VSARDSLVTNHAKPLSRFECPFVRFLPLGVILQRSLYRVGFAGLDYCHYPDLLRERETRESFQLYSVVGGGSSQGFAELRPWQQ
jgi:hypothetical protein